MGRLTAAFARMSRREQILVGAMISILAISVIALVHLWLSASISELETRVSEDRDSLRSIYGKSAAYMDARSKSDRMRDQAARNVNLNLKLAVNEIAKRISFTARNRRGEAEGQKKLSDVMQFDQTQETFLSKKKKKKRKKKGAKKDRKDADEGYYRRDQPITLSGSVGFSAIYELLEEIEASDQMLYVTDIEMTREFGNGYVARKNATFVVSTFYYKGRGGDE